MVVVKTPQEFEITHKTSKIFSIIATHVFYLFQGWKFRAPLVQKAKKFLLHFFFIVFCQNRKTETRIDSPGDQQAHSWQIWYQWSISAEDREQKQSWIFQAAGKDYYYLLESFFLRSTANRRRNYQAVISAR